MSQCCDNCLPRAIERISGELNQRGYIQRNIVKRTAGTCDFINLKGVNARTTIEDLLRSS